MGGVVLVVLVVLAGIVVASVQRGSLEGLSRTELRLGPLLVVAVVVQLAVVLASGLDRLAGLVVALSLASLAALVVLALANRRLPGMTLIAIGAFCNLLVIGLNGGMPVTDGALARSGQVVERSARAPERPDARHVRVDEGTRLRQLGDVLAVRPLATVVSVGDIAQYAGLFLLVQGLMLRDVQRGEGFQEFDYGVRGR
jgi:Family of unknown function (DUF5317)